MKGLKRNKLLSVSVGSKQLLLVETARSFLSTLRYRCLLVRNICDDVFGVGGWLIL